MRSASQHAKSTSPGLLTEKPPLNERDSWDMDPRIQCIIGAMRSSCGERLSVNGMALQLGLSRSRFAHLFREQTGLSFREALIELRLSKAITLLADWRCRIKEVASLCGYSSTASFTKAFRRQFGKSPSDYRHSTFGRQTAHPDNKSKLTT
jgi:transcriptional regulator GlxA family with amidase domain